MPSMQLLGTTVKRRFSIYCQNRNIGKSRAGNRLKMAEALFSLVILALFCVSACATRTPFFPGSGLAIGTALAPAPNDGICKTMVENRGYACEEHKVTTKDGFLLGLQRIPQGRSGGSTPGNKSAVVLQHGMIMDGAIWAISSPDKSLAFILADNGFDVWLANSRGTKSSLVHASLSPNDPAFWDWTWDELAANDLPATLQYVHDQTGQQVHYVGHALGTLVALAALSKNQLSATLRSAALLSPVAYAGQVTSPIAKVGADLLLANASYWLGLAKFDVSGAPVISLVSEICNTPGVDCVDLLTSFTGPNCCLDTSLIAALIVYGAQLTSAKNMIHQCQMIKKGITTMYDYNNEDDNKKHYGQPTPPGYNMSNIPNDFPLFLAYGGADALSDVKDVQLLLDSLKDHVQDKIVVQKIEKYAHLDFLFGINATQLVYDPLVAFLKLH